VGPADVAGAVVAAGLTCAVAGFAGVVTTFVGVVAGFAVAAGLFVVVVVEEEVVEVVVVWAEMKTVVDKTAPAARYTKALLIHVSACSDFPEKSRPRAGNPTKSGITLP